MHRICLTRLVGSAYITVSQLDATLVMLEQLTWNALYDNARRGASGDAISAV
jgi:hypothetical protein